MNSEELKRKINSAGSRFVGMYLEEIKENYEKLICDTDFKTAYVERIFRGPYKPDSKIWIGYT